MSQFAHASAQLVRSHRNIAVAALLALLATLAVVLIIAIGSESSDSSPVGVGVATSQSAGHPDESDVAQAVTGSSSSTTADRRPDESDVSAAIAQP